MDPAATATDTAAMIRRRERSAREVVRDALERVAAAEPQLNAWTHLDPDGADELAGALDERVAAGEDVGPLAGVPFGVKDLEDATGMPTRKGSTWFADAPAAQRDDLHVARLRAAGAIPIGKTATPEFGWAAQTSSDVHGTTRNPWALDRTPGGSSGGTAAAVAAGTIAFGTASDGGGSIRTPANFTGLPGLRPTYGRVPTFGSTHVAQNAVNFALATTVADTALLLDVCAGPDPRDRTCLPAHPLPYTEAIERLDVGGLRIATTDNFGLSAISTDTARVVSDATDDLVAAAGLVRVSIDLDLDPFFDVYRHLEGVDRFVGIPTGLWPDRASELGPHVLPGWEGASRARLPNAAAVETERRALVHRVATWFAQADIIVTPTSSAAAFDAALPWPDAIDGRHVDPFVCISQPMLASVVNLPAMSVPVGLTGDGLPVGLQIMAARHREDLVLRLARHLEIARPWPRHAPFGR